MHLGPSFWEEDELVTNEENDLLQINFSEEEIKEAIMGSYANGAPGPDGLPFLFYHHFWEVIKNDFMALVRDFENGTLDMIMLSWCFQMEMREQMAYIGVSLKRLWEIVNNLSFVEVQELEISMMKSLSQTKRN